MASYHTWNRALLRHYFGDETHGASGPVTYLHVSPQELHDAIMGAAQVSTRLLATPDDALRDFKACVRQAMNNEDFGASLRDCMKPWPEVEPPFVVLLIASCLACAEQESDEAYRDSLDEICGNGRRNNTNGLADAWECLERWLANPPDDVDPLRRLVLPPQREGWRHIGYSLDLTFPSNRDRRALHELFAAKGFVGEPPSGPETVKLLRGAASRFSSQLMNRLDDFVQTNALAEARWLHPLWRAVTQACRDLSSDTPPVEFLHLCAIVRQGRLFPFLMASSERAASECGLQIKELPLADDTFVPAVVDASGAVLGPVELALSGQLRGRSAPDLQALTLYCFAPDEQGRRFHMLARGHRENEADAFLFRANHLADMRSRLLHPTMGKDWKSDAMELRGWRCLVGASLVNGASDDQQSPINGRLPTPFIGFIEGVRIGRGFLGTAPHLPLVNAFGAQSVEAEGPAGVLPLEPFNGRPGVFCFPRTSLSGTYILRASLPFSSVEEGDGRGLLEVVAHVQLYTSAGHVAGRSLTDAQRSRLRVESGTKDSEPLGDSALGELTRSNISDAGTSELEALVVDCIYLGPVVGQLSQTHEPGFDWLLLRGPGKQETRRYVGNPEEWTRPTSTWVSDKGARKVWRTFFRAPSVGPDEAFRAYRELIPRNNLTLEPELEIDPSIRTRAQNDWDSLQGCKSSPSVDSLVEALCAVASQRSLIPASDVRVLFEASLGLRGEPTLYQDGVRRAWLESGALELAWDEGSSHLYYRVRLPWIAYYRIGDSHYAAVMGAISSAVVGKIRQAAQEHGCEWTTREVTCPLVPPSILLTASSRETLDRVARSCELPSPVSVPSLAALAASINAVTRDDRAPPDEGGARRYWCNETARWESPEVRPPPEEGVLIWERGSQRWTKTYQVTSDRQHVWRTECRTWAFLKAARLRGAISLVAHGPTIIREAPELSYLPLPLARYCNIVGAIGSGPEKIPGRVNAYRYRYSLPTRRCAYAVLGVLAESAASEAEKQ